MPQPSYAYRHLLCSELLENQPPPPEFAPFAFGADAESSRAAQIRSRKLDFLLLQGWAGKGKARARDVDDDTQQRVESLRIKKSDFEILGRIGEGQFGTVDAVKCRFDGKVYAMKIMEKFKVQRAGAQLSLPCERYLHIAGATSKQRHVPGMMAAFQTPTSIMMVTEYAPCGTLWDRLSSSLAGRLQEREVRWWTAQMVDAIAWCHDQGFAHRDIKPHNVLLHQTGKLQLTDFGSSSPLRPCLHLAKSACLLPCGTADYIAPEILSFAEEAFMDAMNPDPDKTIKPGDGEERGYTAACDWWSLGAVVYELVDGRAPFWARKVEETYQRIMRFGETLEFGRVEVSLELEDFIRKLLCPVKGRMDYKSIRRHAWLQHPDIKSTSPTVAPSWLSPLSQLDLESLSPSHDITFVNDDTQVGGFDRFFQSSPGLSSLSLTTLTRTDVQPSPSPVEEHAQALPPWYRWLGWTFEPPPTFFSASSAPAPTSATHKAAVSLTPARNRPTPANDPRAIQRLIDCVQDSAKKRFVAASAKRLGTGTITRSRWEPPTPSPMPRPTTATTTSRKRDTGLTLVPSKTPIQIQGLAQGQGRQIQGLEGEGLRALMERHRGLNQQLERLEDKLQFLKASLRSSSPMDA